MADFPDEQEAIGITGKCAGMDIYIGDPHLIDKGLGQIFIRRFVEDIIFATNGYDACMADPNVDNPRSIRAFEKAGFLKYRNVTVPPSKGVACIMLCEKAS